MSNPRKKFDKEMKSFLEALDKNQPIDYENPTIRRCVYECCKRDYVSGFKNCSRADNNKIFFDKVNPCLEKAGYDYLYPKKDWIGIFALFANVVTAVGVLIQLVLSIGG